MASDTCACCNHVNQPYEIAQLELQMWMFKPHIRISYATSNHNFMARSASISAAKVHFKVLGPSVSPTLKRSVIAGSLIRQCAHCI